MPDATTTELTPLQQAVIALQAQRARIAELEQAGSAPIAVVGIGCRYPADGVSPAALWEALREGRDGSREVPPDRWDIDEVYDPVPGRPGKMYVRKGCFIDEVDRFEPLFFRISPREAVGIDPQQRLLLEVAWEALEDAAIAAPALVGSDTGVFIGISTNDYSALLSRTAHGCVGNAVAGPGNAASVAAGRLSYTFGFHGPCVAVDTACSSSLVATHLAVQSLRSRECSLAIVAGVNLMLSPEITINFCQGRMLSPDGHCKTFDAAADGYVRGEGCGALVLKRLTEAEADGDRILAVLRGSAINQDGRSAGLTAPNGIAQEAVIRKALANAGLSPDQIDYVEAHGTGTSLGDPIEMHALKAVFAGRTRPLHVGTVKTNIGHTEAASGVAGLIKAVLILQHQALPPSLHFRRLNPHIDAAGIDFRVPTELIPMPIEAIGVSSFGVSGTNAHIVLGAAPPAPPVAAAPPSARPVLLISARTREALVELIARYRAFLAATSDSFADICHTAAIGRARLPWWVAVGRPGRARDRRARQHAAAGFAADQRAQGGAAHRRVPARALLDRHADRRLFRSGDRPRAAPAARPQTAAAIVGRDALGGGNHPAPSGARLSRRASGRWTRDHARRRLCRDGVVGPPRRGARRARDPAAVCADRGRRAPGSDHPRRGWRGFHRQLPQRRRRRPGAGHPCRRPDCAARQRRQRTARAAGRGARRHAVLRGDGADRGQPRPELSPARCDPSRRWLGQRDIARLRGRGAVRDPPGAARRGLPAGRRSPPRGQRGNALAGRDRYGGAASSAGGVRAGLCQRRSRRLGRRRRHRGRGRGRGGDRNRRAAIPPRRIGQAPEPAFIASNGAMRRCSTCSRRRPFCRRRTTWPLCSPPRAASLPSGTASPPTPARHPRSKRRRPGMSCERSKASASNSAPAPSSPLARWRKAWASTSAITGCCAASSACWRRTASSPAAAGAGGSCRSRRGATPPQWSRRSSKRRPTWPARSPCCGAAARRWPMC